MSFFLLLLAPTGALSERLVTELTGIVWVLKAGGRTRWGMHASTVTLPHHRKQLTPTVLCRIIVSSFLLGPFLSAMKHPHKGCHRALKLRELCLLGLDQLGGLLQRLPRLGLLGGNLL